MKLHIYKVSIFVIVFQILVFFSLFLIRGDVVEAKSVTWNKTETKEFAYYWNWGDGLMSGRTDSSGWSEALDNPNITISYTADVYDVDSGTLINDGANVLVGARLHFIPKAYQDSDISWFGTGYSTDSPNGHWINSAAAPAKSCDAADFVGPYTDIYGSGYDVYIPLSVNPPSNNVDLSGSTATLTDEGGGIYRVDSAGSIKAVFNFNSTTGIYYYRYYWKPAPTGCYANNIPLKEALQPELCFNLRIGGLTIPICQYADEANDLVDYQLNVPAQTISYALTAVPGNTIPNAPTFTGPATAVVNTNPAYTAQATDPDGDQIYYQFDWDNNGTVDTRQPSMTLTNSGTIVGGTKSQSVIGTYTYRARAVDSKGGVSSWTSYTITFTAAPAPTATLTINGSAGPLAVNVGDTLNIAWSSTNAASCTKFGAGWGTGQIVGTSGSNSVTATVADTYIVSCSGISDSVVVTITNRAPAAPSISGSYGGTTVGPFGGTFTFPLVSIDPDNNTIYYQVDWDNNGTIGPGDATTANVPSGNTQPATAPWSNPGTYTFQARATDVPGNMVSPWTTHTLTINPPPAPVTTLEVRVNGGGWTTTDQTVDPGDTIEFKWSATNSPTSCSGTGTGLSVSGPSGTDIATTPAPNTNETFTASCTNTGGTTNDSIVITTNQKPNFTQPTMTLGSFGAFDPVTATYASVPLTFATSNDGGSITKSTAQYLVEPTAKAPLSGTIPTLATGPGGYTNTVTIPGPVSFGTLQVKTSIDTVIASNGSVDEVTEGVADNTRTTNFTVAPPDPVLTITTSKTRLRNTETATITWSVATPYLGLTCQTYGPGISASTLSGAGLTKPIVAKSEYTFKCTEGTTGTTWQKSVWVETEGKLEEV